MPSNMKPLCDALLSNVEKITLEWVGRVQSDPYLRADDNLTLTQIIDHVPQMLEELCELLGKPGEPNFDKIRASSQHGYIRSAEGYSLTELLRELELLRDCVFNFVVETEIKQNFNREDSIRALRLINKYFGEDILFVVEHFLARASRDDLKKSAKAQA
ncbi:MAG: RsbRD N-terminal domain-containing protein [Pyrinomonadaceae bacterium]|nr:RsbRD N-terminal domain-containing protein [Pyrinomonadaceae bacterium]